MTAGIHNNLQTQTTKANDLSVFPVLGVNISAVNLDLAAQRIDDWIKARKSVYVCVAPVSTVIDCQDDPDYKNIINAADMVTPDGMPLVWLAKKGGYNQVDRTYGPDLMQLICKQGEERGYKHFFYGGSRETARSLTTALKGKFPRISITGEYTPGLLAVKQKETDLVIEQINQSGADILWVGLGSPKQDFWMDLHRHEIQVPVMIGAGAAFDFLSGTKPQAPRWMQRSGLEWIFRLCCEPRRLWKRYLIGNSRFIFLLLTRKLFKGSYAGH